MRSVYTLVFIEKVSPSGKKGMGWKKGEKSKVQVTMYKEAHKAISWGEMREFKKVWDLLARVFDTTQEMSSEIVEAIVWNRGKPVSDEAVTHTVPQLLSWVSAVNHFLAESNRHSTCERKDRGLFSLS